MNGEDHSNTFIFGEQVVVSPPPENMVPETCGHDGASH